MASGCRTICIPAPKPLPAAPQKSSETLLHANCWEHKQMGFEPITIFHGELLEGAERLARNTSSDHAPLPASIVRDMGWSSTLIAEKYGGYGGSFNDIGAVLEGLASRAINLPVVTRCCIVPGMLMAATETEA